VEAGAELQWLQAQLGHSGIAMTIDVYRHRAPDKHEHVVVALDLILG
jgi:integrase